MRFFYLIILSSLFSLSQAAVDVNKSISEIDKLIYENLENRRFNSKTDDSTFVRRIYLDIAGRIPSITESETFIQSKETDKRKKLIKKLLSSDAYTSHNFNYWADVLRIKRTGQTKTTSAAYSLWLKDSLRTNKSYQQMVTELLSSEGAVWDNAAASYYLRDSGMPLDNTANTVRIFLGTRIECAQCHDHPFDDCTQM